MFIKIIEDNLRFMFMTTMLFSELVNACQRIQEVLELPEQDQKGITNPAFDSESKNYKIDAVTARYLGYTNFRQVLTTASLCMIYRISFYSLVRRTWR